MKFNLSINYYNEKNTVRKSEIDFCVKQNLVNKEIDNLYVILSGSDLEEFEKLDSEKKGIRIVTEKRPTYNDYFELTRKNPFDLNAFCNTDIFFDSETIRFLKSAEMPYNSCFALSRWDLVETPQTEKEEIKAELFDREDSQDTWIFRGAVPFIEAAEFTPGIAGCDNSIAYVLKTHGYSVSNPSKSIKTFHFHLTNIRSYEIGRPKIKILPPYHYIKPVTIEEVKTDSSIKKFFNFNLKQWSLGLTGKINKNKPNTLQVNEQK